MRAGTSSENTTMHYRNSTHRPPVFITVKFMVLLMAFLLEVHMYLEDAFLDAAAKAK